MAFHLEENENFNSIYVVSTRVFVALNWLVMVEKHLNPLLLIPVDYMEQRGKSSVATLPNEMRSNVSTKKVNVVYMHGRKTSIQKRH
jgi:hypothetical protein